MSVEKKISQDLRRQHEQKEPKQANKPKKKAPNVKKEHGQQGTANETTAPPQPEENFLVDPFWLLFLSESPRRR